MNEIITPKFENTTVQTIKPLSLSWSPSGVFRKNNCALAVVSNSGNVEICIKIGDEWISILNLTKCLVQHFETLWQQENSDKKTMKEEADVHENRVMDCAAICR